VKVRYRKLFLKDIKKLKHLEIYNKICKLVFEKFSEAACLQEIQNIKPLKSCPNRYRIRIGDYRIGIELHGDVVEVMRVLHRREFYRYFP